ncbi:hypothetical protein M0657_005239 [Pyricularia oryzae]|nr:hypothetical protein M0657_005239 [Pyricularia oryzae]
MNRRSVKTIVFLSVDNFIFKSVYKSRHFVVRFSGCRTGGVPNRGYATLNLVRRIQYRRLAKRLSSLPSPPVDALPLLPKAPTHDPAAHRPMCTTKDPPPPLRAVLAVGTKAVTIPACSSYGPRSPARFSFSPAPSSPIDWSRQGRRAIL